MSQPTVRRQRARVEHANGDLFGEKLLQARVSYTVARSWQSAIPAGDARASGTRTLLCRVAALAEAGWMVVVGLCWAAGLVAVLLFVLFGLSSSGHQLAGKVVAGGVMAAGIAVLVWLGRRARRRH